MELPFLLVTLLLISALIALWRAQRRQEALRTRLDLMGLRLRDKASLEARLNDISAQQEALTALSEASYNALLLVDSDHQVMIMNAAARELFQQPPNWRSRADSFISITRHHELDDLVATTLEHSDDPVTQQIVVKSHPFRVRALCVESNNEPFVAIALEDISELQRLGRARRDMVANISHELRTPITSIRLLVDTLQRGAIRDAERVGTLVEKIASETDTLEQMAQELLDLSMIESGRAEFRLLPTSMREIIDDATRRMDELAGRNQLSITHLMNEDYTVLADREQVARVLTNLMHNAIKFTPAGGQIEIGVFPESEFVRVTVTDTGPGIPTSERERIFERFYRADRARRGGGTGLGLAIAKHIVEAHGGRIWADEPPIRDEGLYGAHLCFTLPITEER